MLQEVGRAKDLSAPLKIAPACFGVIIWPSPGRKIQIFLKKIQQ
jgi:hypothetical protein